MRAANVQCAVQEFGKSARARVQDDDDDRRATTTAPASPFSASSFCCSILMLLLHTFPSSRKREREREREPRERFEQLTSSSREIREHHSSADIIRGILLCCLPACLILSLLFPFTLLLTLTHSRSLSLTHPVTILPASSRS